ncbi:MAG: hypothetical protein IT372_04315 [Polyangiaceae bacterium]|nr:hypothetical protein [Polyangiaceae bacterium]
MSDQKPAVSVVHAIDRRVRFRAPALAGRRDPSVQLAERLALEPGIDVVTVNPRTGSVLVESASTPLDPRALRALIAQIVSEIRDESGRSLAAPRPEAQPGPTRVARAVAHAFSGINADVREALDQRADLGTLLPVFFAAGGLVEVAVSGKLPAPAWFNLLWWSLRSFMTFNMTAVEQERVGNGEPLARPA